MIAVAVTTLALLAALAWSAVFISRSALSEANEDQKEKDPQ